MEYQLKIKGDSIWWRNFRTWVEKTYFDERTIWRVAMECGLEYHNARYDCTEDFAIFDTETDATIFLLRFS